MKFLRNKASLKAFDAFLLPFTKLSLSGVRYHFSPGHIPDDHSVVVASNHPSWWDGFLIRSLHRALGGQAPLFTLVLEESRREFPILRQLGTVGIEPGNPVSFWKALRFLRDARRESPVWFSIFPQGHLYPSWDDSAPIARGIKGFTRVLAPATILPVAIHLEVLDRPRPYAFVSVGRPIHSVDGRCDEEEVWDAVTEQLEYIRRSILVFRDTTPAFWSDRIDARIPVSRSLDEVDRIPQNSILRDRGPMPEAG